MKEARIRIAKKINIDKNNCWIWDGNPRVNGYCRTTYKRKSWYIHRLSYAAFVGDIPDGLDVCHTCDIRACCNPSHLFVGTRKDNMQDAKRKGRVARGFKNPQTKLSDNDKKEILLKAKEGVAYTKIAKKYKVSPTSINRITLDNGIRRRKLTY